MSISIRDLGRIMKLLRKTLEKTFADKFKRYTFFLLLIFGAIFLVSDKIDNGYVVSRLTCIL